MSDPKQMEKLTPEQMEKLTKEIGEFIYSGKFKTGFLNRAFELLRLRRLLKKVAELLRLSKEVEFKRGEPVEYFTGIVKLNFGLTLPIVPAERTEKLIRLKCLFVLWNLLVDDEIDEEGTRNQLLNSMLLLTNRMLGKKKAEVGGSAALVLERLLDDLPQNRPERTEMFYFDLLEVMYGFNYQHHFARSLELAGALDHSTYGHMTTSIKQYLDMDCMFAAEEVAPITYRQLRVAYEHLSTAIRFANDIGSLERDLWKENNFNNIIRIWAMEEGVLSKDGSLPPKEESKQVMEKKLKPYIDRAQEKVVGSLAEAEAILSKISQGEGVPKKIDTTRVLNTITKFLGMYSSGRDPGFIKK